MSGIEEDYNSQLRLSSSLSRVTYSCGSCGYELNLNAENRNSSSIICSKYGKIIKKGIITFFCIDETRFDQVEKFQWVPFFSRGFLRRRTKLLCRKCGNHIGNAYSESSNSNDFSRPRIVDNKLPCSIAWDGISNSRVYDIKIRSLQPSNTDEYY